MKLENRNEQMPQGRELKHRIESRQKRGKTWQLFFRLATAVGIIALAALLYNIANQSVGLVAIENAVEPTQLTTILSDHVSKGLMRRFEHEQPFAQRSQANVLGLVEARVVEPTIVASWDLVESLLNRSEIEAEMATQHPTAQVSYRSWLTSEFLQKPQSSRPELAGIRTAILGTLWTLLVTLLFALPVGVGAAIYLEEYAQETWINRVIKTNIDNLAGVPSIIYGMLGLVIFVRMLEPFTSGQLFGVVEDSTTANGRTILSAGLTLGLLVLPLIIINAQEAIRAVPKSLRDAGYGLGATQWQVIWSHVLPSAMPGILTGNILAMSRAIGETAPMSSVILLRRPLLSCWCCCSRSMLQPYCCGTVTVRKYNQKVTISSNFLGH